uniref:FRA10A associated CGG repeat 1 n=1 Tax=Leptobrachium leishanense TaxID=445787 RepID=A0A8C5M7Q6_9ANUR
MAKYALGLGGYGSDFSDEEEDQNKTDDRKRLQKNEELLKKPFQKDKYGKVAHRQVAADEWDREEARNWRVHLISMDAFARHQKYVNDYILYYGGKLQEFQRSRANDKTDLDVIKENHRFLWPEDDEEDMTWEKRLAKKYYDKLFKEYCIADLSRYKENKFGFRWRTEKEVISGKGQFCCGNKRCDEKEGLKSWEVNFGYVEHGEKRNALVKLSGRKFRQRNAKGNWKKRAKKNLQRRNPNLPVHTRRTRGKTQRTARMKKANRTQTTGKAPSKSPTISPGKTSLMNTFKICFCSIEFTCDIKVYIILFLNTFSRVDKSLFFF